MSDTSVDQAKGASEDKPAVAANETDELDQILAEFDKEEPGAEQTQQNQADSQANESDLAAQVQKLVQAQEASDRKAAEADMQTGIQEAIGWGMDVLKEKEIKAPDGTEKLFRGFLEAEAQEDKRIAQAFANRHSRPSAWKKVVVAKAGEFSRFFPGSSDTQRERISAAVAQSRSGETKGSDFPSEEEIGRMNDREFFKLAKGMMG